MTDISYSSGLKVQEAIIQIWGDMHSECAGRYRAFWCSSPGDDCGSPVIGYCSSGGSHRTIIATALEVRRMYPHDPIYRNGRLLKI